MGVFALEAFGRERGRKTFIVKTVSVLTKGHPMMSLNWAFLVMFGSLMQVLIVVSMRQYNAGFWKILPLLMLMEWAFMTAYADKRSAFAVIWFASAGLTTLLLLWVGTAMFHDRVGAGQICGMALILLGIFMVRVPA